MVSRAVTQRGLTSILSRVSKLCEIPANVNTVFWTERIYKLQQDKLLYYDNVNQTKKTYEILPILQCLIGENL